MTIPRINPAIIAAHHARVVAAKTTADSYYASWWLTALRSPTGNDILQELAVTAVGKVNAEGKHGADSADGELEAKPFKRAYNAHISDDTPASLMRHHTIPFIVLLSASDDGQMVNWVLLTSYRLFDDARAAGMGLTMPLPTDLDERMKALTTLNAARKKGEYKRSNPLPFAVLQDLKPGQYDVWVNPTLPASRRKDFTLVKELAARNTGMTEVFTQAQRAIAAAVAQKLTGAVAQISSSDDDDAK